MTQDILNEKCDCGQTWRDYHVLKSVIGDKVSILCYPQPTPLQTEENRTYLRYVLDAHASKKKAEADLKDFKKQVELDKQKAEATLKRALEASHTADLKTLEAEHKQALADGELTRVQLVTSHEAKVLDLEARLAEAKGETEVVRKDLTGKLAASEAKATDLQTEIDGLNRQLEELRARHKGLKDRSLDIVRLLVSVGTRVVVLEEKTGVVPKVDAKTVFKTVLGIDFDEDEEVIPLTQLRNDPTPVPAVAPKASNGTSAPVPVNGTPTAAPKATAAPAAASEPQPRLRVLGGSDDDQEDEALEVSDDHVVSESAAADEESDDHDAEECDACDKHAKYAMTFVGKDGAQMKIISCEPTAHGQIFFDHMKKLAKKPPPSVNDIKLFFQQINP